MGELVDHLRTVLREVLGKPNDHSLRDLVQRAYHNDPRLYRSQNRRPRTNLMVKGLSDSPFEHHGLIAQSAARTLAQPASKASISYERYTDIGFLSGEWWSGTSRWELIAEIENNWAELRGTISDLFHIQAKRKWCVLYHENLAVAADEALRAVGEVRHAVASSGIMENPKTAYEILVFPEELESGLLGSDVVEICFLAGHLVDAVASRRIVV